MIFLKKNERLSTILAWHLAVGGGPYCAGRGPRGPNPPPPSGRSKHPCPPVQPWWRPSSAAIVYSLYVSGSLVVASCCAMIATFFTLPGLPACAHRPFTLAVVTYCNTFFFTAQERHVVGKAAVKPVLSSTAAQHHLLCRCPCSAHMMAGIAVSVAYDPLPPLEPGHIHIPLHRIHFLAGDSFLHSRSLWSMRLVCCFGRALHLGLCTLLASVLLSARASRLFSQTLAKETLPPG